MHRNKLISNFSRRLTMLARKEGHGSNRSKAGIDIKELANITGCSYQMARKYALGQALPELSVVIKIATWLETSPSWLLFGDDDTLPIKKTTDTTIEIEKELLKYILRKSCILLSTTNNYEDVINFITDAIYDASHLNADIKTVHKIIDMMVSSAKLINIQTMEGNTKYASNLSAR